MREKSTSGAFYSRVQEKLDSLSKKERKTVEYMADN